MKSPPSADRQATIQDLKATPDDGRKYELVDGRILVTPAGMRHSQVGGQILRLLGNALEGTDAGFVYTSDVGLILPSGNLRSPDVSFVRKEKLPNGRSPDSFGEVVPDLVVEVLSPSDTARRVADKIGEFLESGTTLVWLVDPASRTVTVYRSLSDTEHLTEDQTITGAPVLPQFSANVARFFD